MTSAAAELVDYLRGLKIHLYLDETGTLRARGPRGALVPYVAEQIRDAKDELTQALKAAEAAVAWRAEAMRARVGPDGELPADLVVDDLDREPGRCRSCGDLIPFDQIGKCTNCCRAAARIVLEKLAARNDIPQEPAA
jgi:hypothetical protein